MATAVLLPNGKQTFLDGNGEPLAGGSVYFYIPNTTTFKNTWQDPLEQTLNTNPVTLDSAGTAIVYGEGQYRQIVKDSSGNTIWDQLTSSPPTVGPQATLSSASTTDLGSTNVNVIEITGTTTINSFGSSADVNVPIYFLTFSGSLTLTYNATSMILPGGVNIATQANGSCVALYLGSGNWQVLSYQPNVVATNAPTIQQFTSGSGTYTTPTGVKWIEVELVGGGGGGCGAGTAGGGSGGAGGNTTFGSAFLTGAGGSGGSQPGGAGGAATGNTGAIAIAGGSGNAGAADMSEGPGGTGAAGPWGGAGGGGYGGAGVAAAANSGAGGGGGGGTGSANIITGGGGGAGGYVKAVITSPSATYSYAVGAGGAAGTSGSSGGGGGAGGSGLIRVIEHYNY